MWQSLNGGVDESDQEVQRLKKLLVFYEQENLSAKSEVASLKESVSNLIESAAGHEKNTLKLQRQIKSLEGTIKFDRIASDGITKKAGVLEFEVNNLRDERKTLIEDQIHSRRRIKELEQALCDDRSKVSLHSRTVESI
jgi:chromosome segregation ATPase